MSTSIELNLFSFRGFYGTNLELRELYDDEEDTTRQQELDDYNYVKSLMNIIGEEYFKLWYNINKKWLDEVGIKLEFVKVDSPRFYNYSNDTLVLNAEFDKEVTKSKLIKLINENKDQFQSYLDENYTPRDGFIPYADNDLNKWIEEYSNKVDSKANILSSFIQAFELDEDENRESIENNIIERAYEF